MEQNQIITLAARSKMCRARAGDIQQLPIIAGFVFGDGGVDAEGAVLAPTEQETQLANEQLRKPYDSYTLLNNGTSCRYECTLEDNELPNCKISEIGLYDKEGDILVIKRFAPKIKDTDFAMTFWVEDIF